MAIPHISPWIQGRTPKHNLRLTTRQVELAPAQCAPKKIFVALVTQRESNSRLDNPVHKLVDPPGIEPGPRQCECRVMPLYYGPILRPQVCVRGAARMFPFCIKILRFLSTKRNPPKP